jgi:hypothetical protein
MYDDPVGVSRSFPVGECFSRRELFPPKPPIPP